MDLKRFALLLTLSTLFNILIVAAATINVPVDFGTIQGAITAATDGDIINVDSGTYNENIIIDKRLTLNGSSTIIDCLASGAGITITGNNSIVQGFDITNCDIGIEILGVNNRIKNNSIYSNTEGININNSRANNFTFNEIFSNGFGLRNFDPNFTTNATPNYWGSCDGPSGAGTGSGDSVSQNVSFTPWIGICITNKTGGSCAVEKDNVTLTANLASLLNIQNVWVTYTVNGTNYNNTAISQGSNYVYTIPSSLLLGTGGQNVT